MVAFFSGGGLMMIPLAGCAVFATFSIFERFFYYRTVSAQDRTLKAALQDLLVRRDWTAAKTACDEAATPLAQVLKKVLESRAMSEQTIRELAEVELNAVLPRLERFVPALGTIAQVSTLLGLLGTVLGNIKAFGLLGSGGAMGDPALLAGAIAQALFTTAAGLAVSIPAIVFHTYYNTKVERIAADAESFASGLIFTITRGL